MLGYDATHDVNRLNPTAHYRLYWDKRGGQLTVIHVQDFDYPDYDVTCFVNYAAYDTRGAAQQALVNFLLDAQLLATSRS